MPIYHVTYLSDGLRIKGYLGLPHGYEEEVREVQNWVQQACETTDSLPVQRLPEGSGLPHPIIPASPAKKLPGFIYCRGGIGKVGMVKLDWVAAFAQAGYAVFAPSYRGTEGGEGRDEFGGADQEDVHVAFRIICQIPFVDAARVSVMGFSRGAINAALTASAEPRTHRLILWGGVSDLQATYEERADIRRMLRRTTGGTPTNKPQSYRDRSPITFAEKFMCPVLIMHGTADVQVDFIHGLSLYNHLTQLRKSVTLYRYEKLGHHLPALDHDQAVRDMFRWVESDPTPQ